MYLSDYTPQVITGLSFLAIVGQIIILVVAILLLADLFKKKQSAILQWVSRHGILLMFIAALTATCGSLFFSEIANFVPCKDCWFQRIFMYPQVILLAISLWKRDRTIARYILALSIIGILISTSHYIEQVQAAMQPIASNATASPLKPCDASGVSCASTQIKFAFGYITIPLMAWTVFGLNILGSIIMMRSDSRKKQ